MIKSGPTLPETRYAETNCWKQSTHMDDTSVRNRQERVNIMTGRMLLFLERNPAAQRVFETNWPIINISDLFFLFLFTLFLFYSFFL